MRRLLVVSFVLQIVAADRNGKLLGVSAVDFSLLGLGQYLDRIKLSKTKQIFAIE